MTINIDRKNETLAVVDITADSQEIAKIKTKTLNKLAPRVKVAGFREGKVPISVVEKNVDPNLLQDEFLNDAINSLYISVIKSEKIRPAGQPSVSVKKFVPFSELEFTMEIPVIGEIILPNYKKISIKKPEIKVDAKQVDEVLKNLQTRASEKKEVKREAKITDEAWIDFAGVDAKTKKPVAGADGKDYPLVLGSGAFIPGFEDNVVGMKIGEKKTFEVTFPKDYGAKALQNAKVDFTVTLNKINEVVLPKIDDKFASTVGPFENLAQLKADIKKQLEHDAKHKADKDFEAEIVNSLADKTKVKLPDTIIDEQIEMVVQEVRQNSVTRGLTYEEMLASVGKTEEQFIETEVRPEAIRRVKAGLMLSEIADIEGIDVEPEELEVRIQALKTQYRDSQMLEELDKPENRREINARIRTEKVLKYLKDLTKTK